MDLDLRKLRYFVAVADHLNFGRASEALHIGQPVLSRQIRALEHELKAQLFERDNRETSLTPAGEALLGDARSLLQAADATCRRVRGVAAGGQQTFTVGFMPGLIVTDAVRELSRRHPELSTEVMRTDWFNQTDAIRDGRTDIGYVRLPADLHGLATEQLLSEPRVVVVPAGHQLAGKEVIVVAELADEHLLQDPDAVPEWRDIATELRSARPRPASPVLRSVEEKLEHVAAGHGIAVLPLSTATYYTRPDVAHIAVCDLAPNQVCLAWEAHRKDPLIREFAEIARSGLA